MKTSPNREQFLFLGAGGIILGLILVVVVFNMWGSDTSKRAEEETNVRPVVSLPPQKGPPTDKNGTASVFANQGLPPLPEDVPAKVMPESGPSHTVVPPTSALAPSPDKKADTAKIAAKTPVKSDTPPPAAKAITKPEPAAKPEPVKTATAKAPPAENSKPAATKATATETSKPPASQASKSTTPEGRFAVNMGAFKDETRANANKTKLSGLGLPTYLQPTTDKTGATLYRLRLGPFATRTDAETASRMAKDKAGITGTVIANGQ